ncbi:DUF2061 domain-containing protein [Aquibaculum arenosum]|uniref:DUF2061 domain-containing protein n=1 Tax=Aquibaculum arenosum TaxID=3032591 RepID=A0ABT5YL68_9PROT|nr:DUF2061 domain-containing protein [Fodinicurvata sp. CAU 1616]MDF2095701.1 DUF2061 domain-containing protein [Fodinicurvata sp. CAU 1616]
MQRDVIKTLSYAGVHFTVAFGVVYLLTGSLPIATGVAMLEPLANTFAYFLHERAWNLAGKRRAAPDQPATQPPEGLAAV